VIGGGVAIAALLIGGGVLVVAGASYIASSGALGALITTCANSPFAMALVTGLIAQKTGLDIP
jgi:homoaconitase/3-isopropylmalate dehydratase large subunit